VVIDAGGVSVICVAVLVPLSAGLDVDPKNVMATFAYVPVLTVSV
jgi:hypothetical protein